MEDKLRNFLHSRFGDSIISEDNFRAQQSFIIASQALIPICQALADDRELAVNYLADITAVDWLGCEDEKKGRFEVVYNLYSLKHGYRFFLKAMLPAEEPEIASLTPLWRGADWMERELWDMMGIKFSGHPDLARILTPDDLEGHPLRRDFPLTYEVPQFSWNKDEPPEVVR